MIAILEGWAEASGPAEPDAGVSEDVARLTRAILQGDERVFKEYGGLQAAMKRNGALKERARQVLAQGPIHCGSTWQTVRL